MKRSIPTRQRTRHRSDRQRIPDVPPAQPVDRFRIVYVVIASLVICSMLAVALVSLDLSNLFGSNKEDEENYIDQQANIIAEQETVVAENPDDVNEIVFLANLLGNTDRQQEAIPWYERAIEMAPDDNGIRLDFARMLSSAGLTTDAEAQYQIVLEADPQNQQGHYYLAQMYLSLDPSRADQAIAHLQRSIELGDSPSLTENAREQLDVLQPGSPVATLATTPE